jgi:acetoin utilization deacetylase AcuC-like enzyme
LLPLFYCDHYDIPLPPGHRFPLRKYRLLREALTADGTCDLQPALPALQHDLRRIHDARFVTEFIEGTLDPQKMRRIGFPWSPGLVDRTLGSVGGTLSATRTALATGLAGVLAGGTHHAFRSEGSGFCVFNDMAVSAAWLLERHPSLRIAIIDLDVHQGDGTAAIFAEEPRVFSLSLHGAHNFPFRKQKSSLDIEFPDLATDQPYMEALKQGLAAVSAFHPDFAFFQSGVDGLSGDRLGRLSLSLGGLAERDRMVLSWMIAQGVSGVITLGGGYSDPIERTVEAHLQTFRQGAKFFPAFPKPHPSFCR